MLILSLCASNIFNYVCYTRNVVEQREVREKIERELAAKLAEKEEETERLLKEAEEERKKDREAVEEVL